MPLVFFVIFVVVPVTEIWLFIQVQDVIGFGPALLLLVLAAVLGVYVWRLAGARGRSALRKAQAGTAPSPRETADVGLLWLAGLLLFLPGYLTDVAGLLLLLPPVRALVRGTLGRRLSRRVVVMRRDVITGQVVREDEPGQSPPRTPPELPE